MEKLALGFLALSLHANAELFSNDNLWAEIPGQVQEGSDALLYCQLPGGQDITQCRYVNSAGNVWTIDGNTITDGDENPVSDDYQVYNAGTPKSVCGINITSLTSNDLGLFLLHNTQ